MKLLETLSLKSTYDEVEKVEDILLAVQKNLNFSDELYARMMLAVSEAVTNGILHGNKLDAQKTVELSAYQDGNRLMFVSKDEGDGFDRDKIPNPTTEENLLKPSGRGVFLMEEYADEVSFSDGGRTITLSFNLQE